ncbi:MAG: response regulator [Rhodobacteraceae bacterium]|nr:response regulator [Paracoccaceae bacterium]
MAADVDHRSSEVKIRPPRLKWYLGRWAAVLIVGPALLGICVLVSFLATINGQIEQQRAAISGNLTWEVAQLEVDVLNFRVKVDQALLSGDPPAAATLRDLRTSYDVLYSRLVLLAARDYGAILASGDSYLGGIDRERLYLLGLSPTFDGPDDKLAAALPGLDHALAGVHEAIRASVVRTLESLVAAAEIRRVAMQNLLIEFTLAAGMMIIFLMGTAAAFLALMRTAARRARQSERVSSQLTSTIEASIDAVVLVGDTGRILEINSAAETTFGRTSDQMVGAMIDGLVLGPELDDLRAAMARSTPLAAGFLARRRILTGIRGDSSTFPLETTIALEHDIDGNTLYICFLRDISNDLAAADDLRRARDAALRSEEAKSRFLAVVSHEMRTPLTGVIAALEMLDASTNRQAAETEDFIRIARSSARTALEQVDDLLEFARLNQPTLQEVAAPYDIVGQIHEIAEQFQALAWEGRNRLSVDVSGIRAERIVSFRRRIGRILANLLSNATKFTRGGDIQVTAELSAEDGGAVLTLVVEDAGIGIAPEVQGRIFDSFETGDASYSRPRTGTGLGLSIVRLALEKMEGSVTLESSPGAGSKFTVRIPVEIAASAPAALSPHSGAAGEVPDSVTAERPLEILLAEDSDINRTIIRQMILHLGHRVTETCNGEEAMIAAAERQFDLILMDVSMPVMDGLEATREIRATGIGQPLVVGLTAHVLPQHREECLAAGMDAVETKPITLARLSFVLSRAAGVHDEPGPEPALLDTQVLSEAREVLGEQRFRDAVLRVHRESALLLDDLPARLASYDATDLRHQVHRMAGSLGMIGAKAVVTALSEVEHALELSCPEDLIASRVDRVAQLWRLTSVLLLQIANA